MAKIKLRNSIFLEDFNKPFIVAEVNTSHFGDIDLAKKQSSDNPVFYIQYAHARACSILKSTADENIKSNNLNLSLLDNEHEINFYTGMFDFSDDGQRAALFGVEHQNENLVRDSFLGSISPVTGFMITENNAAYGYTGIQAFYNIGKINFTPSFTPGVYSQGDGKDLGHTIEFKSELQFSLDISSESELGFSYNHISNASLGDNNPGANSYMFNFLKKF